MDEQRKQSVRSETDVLGLLPVEGSRYPVSVEQVRVLGHGRAAEARLVRATDADGHQYLCVEKVFRPGLLTRTIYRAAFQSPFAYQDNAEAIRASYYRRRVAAAIIKAFFPEARVASPLYVRWDQQSQAMVLASEFIEGRGIRPAAVDSHRVRRSIARWKSPSCTPSGDFAEIDQLVDVMTRLESLLIDSGMTGSGWQVCKRALVSTANLLKTETGYVVVDLESGIPSVLVPSYIVAGFKLRSVPLFDDVDAAKLISWIESRRHDLTQTLSSFEMSRLESDVRLLIEHSDNWKLAELALLRQPKRLANRDFRDRYRQRVLDSWQRRDTVDRSIIDSLHDGGRFFTSPIFLMGLVPGRPGRFLQRVIGNTGFRQKFKRWIADRSYRQQVNDQYMLRKAQSWRNENRLPGEKREAISRFTFPFHWALSKTTPPMLHRWLGDPGYRRQRQLRLFLFCVNGRFQRELGRFYIGSRLHLWQCEQRIGQDEVTRLQSQLNDQAVDEYVRGFGMHVGLKLMAPLVLSLKFGGAAASVASGNPVYFLSMLMLVPMLRTALTLYRKFATGRPLADYRDALIVGALPVVGSIAFPVQMFCKFPGLSLFLVRDFASRLGRFIPIYGGKDSRTEIAIIRLVDIIAEVLEIWSTITRSQTPVEESSMAPDATADGQSVVGKIGRWDKLVNEQLSLLTQEAEVTANGEAVAGDRVRAA